MYIILLAKYNVGNDIHHAIQTWGVQTV